MNAREVAFNLIFDILEKKEKSGDALTATLEASGLDRRDRAFAHRLTLSSVERAVTIDFFIDQVSKVKVNKQKPVIRTALRMGVCQIFYMDRVPDSAAVNETVKLVRKRGFSGLSGFVNGVLREILRQKDSLLLRSMEERYIKYSCPQWLCSFFIKNYGEESAEKILSGLLRNPPLTIRVNTGRISLDSYEKLLISQGINYKKGDIHENAIIIQDAEVTGLPGFFEGYFQVQDESSMCVAAKAGLKMGDVVIDVCAAPGGKSLHAADILASLGGGRVIARDLTEKKVALVQENILRSGFSDITAEVGDATVLDERYINKADVLIADLPCSGLGIIGKKPDIKYNITETTLVELAELQRQILQTVDKYLKKGGTLMYSTCTINKGENEENVDFICDRLGYKLIEMKQLLPGEPCDGFFYAKLVKL